MILVEKTNLTLGDVINIMDFDEYAVIIKQGNDDSFSPKGRPLIQPPTALYFDKNDDGILKSTKSNYEIVVGRPPLGYATHRYKIVSKEEYQKLWELKDIVNGVGETIYAEKGNWK